MRERHRVTVMSPRALVRQAIAIALEASFSVTESVAYATRGPTPDIAIVDLDAATEDTQVLVRRLAAQLADTYLIVVGTASRLAAAAGAAVVAELESDRADLALLRTVATKREVKPSPALARAHRLWAEVTTRQRDVLRWLAIGADNAAIAHRLRIGERAVKAHVSALLVLFGAGNRTQLALLASQAGLRPPVR